MYILTYIYTYTYIHIYIHESLLSTSKNRDIMQQCTSHLCNYSCNIHTCVTMFVTRLSHSHIYQPQKKDWRQKSWAFDCDKAIRLGV